MARFTTRQILTVILFSWSQFCVALCISLQAPFYPVEAELKGATPSEYGFVFGIYELIVFLCCPIFGKFLGHWGVNFVNNAGMFVISVTCTLFGFLVYVPTAGSFIGLSFAIRIMEAIGYSAFTTATFSIVAGEFPDNVGSMFANIETFFGLGLIVGPTIGGALYDVGGFLLPFVTVGGTLCVTGILLFFLLPPQREAIDSSSSKGFSFFLKKSQFLFGVATIFCTAFSIGFIQAVLEPHLRLLNLTMFEISIMFIITGVAYFCITPVWGKLCDSYLQPRVVCAIGSVVIVVAFLLVGPAPYLPVKISLGIVISALVLQGIGNGACLMASFSGFHKDALALGLQNDISTYGVISGLWMSTFALGAFVGPSAAGVLYDEVGFQWASQINVLFHGVLVVAYLFYFCCSSKQLSDEQQPLLRDRRSDTENALVF